MLALAIILPFTLRYSSEFSKPPQSFYIFIGIVGYGLPLLFFTTNVIRLWRWADEYPSVSDAFDAKTQSKVLTGESKDEPSSGTTLGSDRSDVTGR